MSLRKILAVLITALMTLTLGVVGSQSAAAQTVVDVTDFGASPYGDADVAEAVPAAIAHAKTLDGPVTVASRRASTTSTRTRPPSARSTSPTLWVPSRPTR